MLDAYTSSGSLEQSTRQARVLKVVSAFKNSNKAYLVPGDV